MWFAWRRQHRRNVVATIRIAGLVAVAFVTVGGAARSGSPDPVAVLFGVLPLAAFLWLVVSGCFGYGSARRSDWVALVPFFVALAIREMFTLHSVQEIEIQFAQGPVGRHSVVYPILQMFFVPLVGDSHWFTMHMNGVLGAVASLSMYLFVRQRVGSRAAGFLCAIFFATHPLIARFAPTDGPYSLLLATWFSGLALLSARELKARSLFGGLVLLGIAATTRIEGAVLLVASGLLLDLRTVIVGLRQHRATAVFGFLVVYALGAVQIYVLFPQYSSALSAAIPRFDWLFTDGLWPAAYNDPVFMSLVWTGALAGIWSRDRFGLWAYLATLVVLVPVTRSGQWVVSSHRMIPTCAVQTMVAGIGVYSVTAWIPWMRRRRWLAVVPGVLAAVWVLVQHRSDLIRPYVFNEEYQMVRSHLAPAGVAARDCTLMTFNANFVGDIDLHDFGQVVPGMRVLDCRRTNCVAALSRGGCFQYVRSAACYFRADGVPSACAASGVTATGDRHACLNAACASFEKAVVLQPIETRVIDIAHTFPDRAHYNYPEAGEVGLFRVQGAQAAVLEGANRAAAPGEPGVPMEEERGPSVPNGAVDTSGSELAIRPGQEDLLAAMLGKGTTLPGECKLTAGAVDYTLINATYTCAAGRVVIQLLHPSKAGAAATQTARFAITVLGGSPPAGFLGALQSLIRSREGAFQWEFLPTRRASPALLPLALGGLLGMAALGWLLRPPRVGSRS